MNSHTRVFAEADPVVALAARRYALTAIGNRDETDDDAATVIFAEEWEVGLSIMRVSATTSVGVGEKLKFVGYRMQDGTFESELVLGPCILRIAVALLAGEQPSQDMIWTLEAVRQLLELNGQIHGAEPDQLRALDNAIETLSALLIDDDG